jgi:hypothetical protein
MPLATPRVVMSDPEKTPYTVHHWALAGALVISAAAFLVPNRWAAQLLAGSDSPRLGTVVVGVWVFKMALLANVAGLFVLRRMSRLPSEGTLLEEVRKPDWVGRPWRGEGWIVAMLVMVAAALRLYDLGDGLWYDEITTLVQYVRLPVGQILTTFDSQNQHVL